MTDIQSSIQDDIRLLEEKIKELDNNKKDLEELSQRYSLFADTEDLLLSNYHQNISAFEEYFPDVHQVLINHRPQLHHIDIVDGQANIRNVDDHSTFYKYSPYLESYLQYQNYLSFPAASEIGVQQNLRNAQGYLHSDYLNKLLTFEKDHAAEKGTQGLGYDVPELVLFGLGLGYILEFFVFNHRVKNLYLYEPELDVFFASLFCCQWVEVLKKLDHQGCTLHLCVGINSQEFFDSYSDKLFVRGRFNISKTYGHIHYLSPQIDEAVQEYKARKAELSNGWGFYDDGVMAIANQGENLKRGSVFIKPVARKNLALANVPVFICANGPSLDTHAQFIKDNADKAIIISCGSTLKALHGYGIKPDFHCEQERTRTTLDVLNYIEDEDYFKTLTLLCPGTVHPEVIEKFPKVLQVPKASEPSTFALMTCPGFEEAHPPAELISPTVANTALYMSQALGFSQIYLFGVDLGYRQDGQHHSKMSMYYKDGGVDSRLFWKEKSHSVKGNFGGEFYANDFFNMSRINMEKLLAENGQLSCFNCNDGVAISGTIPCHVEELAFDEVLDKEAFIGALLAERVDAIDYQALFAQYWSVLEPAHISDMCQDIVGIFNEAELSSRSQADKALDSVYDYFFSKGAADTMATIALLDGSVIYFQSVLKRILFGHRDEALALANFKSALAIYIDFLEAIPEHYRARYQTLDNINFKSLFGY